MTAEPAVTPISAAEIADWALRLSRTPARLCPQARRIAREMDARAAAVRAYSAAEAARLRARVTDAQLAEVAAMVRQDVMSFADARRLLWMAAVPAGQVDLPTDVGRSLAAELGRALAAAMLGVAPAERPAEGAAP